MTHFLLPLMMLAQSPAVEVVENDALYEEVAPDEVKKIFARDSRKAALMEVEHPMQDICVRILLAGSRVKARLICQPKASWKAYVAALDAMDHEWDSGQRGLRTEELERGFGGPGRAYGPGG